jgi:hypothetical protein
MEKVFLGFVMNVDQKCVVEWKPFSKTKIIFLVTLYTGNFSYS